MNIKSKFAVFEDAAIFILRVILVICGAKLLAVGLHSDIVGLGVVFLAIAVLRSSK